MVLGLLLVASTGTFTGLLVADNRSGGPSHTVTLLGQRLATLNPLEIFSSGIVLALLFSLGLSMVGAARRSRAPGTRRRLRRRRRAAHDRGWRER
jgi:hypothetical protein